MEIYEVTKLIQTISRFYPSNFRVKPEELEVFVEDWFSVLENEDSTKIAKNLKEHLRTKHFPPTIADLLRVNVNQERAIPGIEETRLLLEKMDSVVPATKEERERALGGMNDLVKGWKKNE